LALLLAEADKLDVSDIAAGVVKHIINRQPVLGRFPLRQSEEGDSFTWNRQNTIGTATAVDPNEDLSGVEAASTFSNRTVNLRIYVREARVDKFIQQTRSKHTSQAAQQLRDALQAIAEKFLDDFLYGDNATNSKEFSGVHKLMDDTNQGQNEAGSALNLTNLDNVIYVKAKMPMPNRFLSCSPEIYTRWAAAMRDTAIIGTVNWNPDDVATQVVRFGQLPIFVNDFITQTETNADPPTKTGSNTSSMFLIEPGEVEEGGLSFVTNGEFIQSEFFPQLEAYDAVKWRLKMYIALADGARFSINRVRGITDAAIAA